MTMALMQSHSPGPGPACKCLAFRFIWEHRLSLCSLSVLRQSFGFTHRAGTLFRVPRIDTLATHRSGP